MEHWPQLLLALFGITAGIYLIWLVTGTMRRRLPRTHRPQAENVVLEEPQRRRRVRHEVEPGSDEEEEWLDE